MKKQVVVFANGEILRYCDDDGDIFIKHVFESKILQCARSLQDQQ
jgi:hypothetical protein